MLEIRTVAQLQIQIQKLKAENKSIGLVPTMGYLHEGHGSLIRKARSENDVVLVSIFVNPKQFGPNEDLDKYPRDLEKDHQFCSSLGADILFIPEASDMYPEGFNSFADVYQLGDNLCGAKREGHFRGVCTVLIKLFNLSKADRAYFGEKDAQQLTIVRRFVRDFNFDLQIIPCPIVREEDGLAKSSRNSYLNSQERKAATIINRALQLGKQLVEQGQTSAAVVLDAIRSEIMSEDMARIDYLQAVDLENMKDVEVIRKNTLIATAVYIGKTRLIDNFIV